MEITAPIICVETSVDMFTPLSYLKRMVAGIGLRMASHIPDLGTTWGHTTGLSMVFDKMPDGEQRGDTSTIPIVTDVQYKVFKS